MAIIHGGDLDSVVRQYGLAREEILDFSGNINPFGISSKAKEAILQNIDKVATYPDSNYVSLRKAISEYVGADIESIIVGNGSTELISLYIKKYAARKTIIVAPAYSEYEREVKLLSDECEYFALKEENCFNADIDDLMSRLNSDISLLIVCNPNNPTGTAIEINDMRRIAKRCAESGINMLIDETYAEFSDEKKYSSIPLVEAHDNIAVIRGTAKFFASPGLRLGYMVASAKIIGEIRRKKDPWSVNILAAIAGEQFFCDNEYILKTKMLINEQREKIKNELSTWRNIKYYDTKTNFQLFKLLRTSITSAEIFEKLIAKGIMIRDAKSFMFLDDSFIRFCFLKDEDNTRLLNELAEFCK